AEKIDRDALYTPLQATTLAKESGSKNYDSTVDAVVRLGVDPRKADQMVRGTVNLPHGTGKTARVLVFATGANADAAREAGADSAASSARGTGGRTGRPARSPSTSPRPSATSRAARSSSASIVTPTCTSSWARRRSPPSSSPRTTARPSRRSCV